MYLKLLVLISIVACGSASNNNNESTPSYDGTYSLTCHPSGSSYINSTITFSGSKFNQDDTVYSDSKCSKELYKANAEATIKFVSDAGSVGKSNVEFTYSKMEVTISDSSTLKSFNTIAVGEKSNWQLNTKTSVIGKKKNSTSPDFYDIIRNNQIQKYDTTISIGTPVTDSRTGAKEILFSENYKKNN